jgi:glutamyl-tRNA reductase
MRVACGLDSLVLGEPQILGQIKQAYNSAKHHNGIRPTFERLFQKTFSVAKQVRTETEIGASAVSVAYAAVNLAKHIYGQLDKTRVLLIGAGETIELVAKHLYQHHPKSITVANRTIERAQGLAEDIEGEVISLAQLPNELHKSDIVISSTASTLPIIGKGVVEQALKQRRHKPMLLIDIAVPRDIESQVGELDAAYLYSVDDLQAIVSENMASREQAARQAQKIIEEKTREFIQWQRSLQSVDVIREYRKNAQDVKNELVEKALNQLQSGKSSEKVLLELANKLTNRLTHAPTRAIQEAAKQGDIEQLAQLKHTLGIEQE